MPDKINDSSVIDISQEYSEWSEVLSEVRCKTIIDACVSFLPDTHPFFMIWNRYELSIILCDDAKIQQVNAEWREKDKPTNVLSFPQFDDLYEFGTYPEDIEVPIGDIFIAYETIKRESVEQNKSIEAHAAHMLVHGFLHLLGYDHIDDEEAEEMESLEVQILERLSIANPYKT